MSIQEKTKIKVMPRFLSYALFRCSKYIPFFSSMNPFQANVGETLPNTNPKLEINVLLYSGGRNNGRSMGITGLISLNVRPEFCWMRSLFSFGVPEKGLFEIP